MIRKTFFWAHLIAGVLSGVVVLIMSVTGVLLTYERQILAWSAETHYVPREEQTTPLPLSQLLLITQTENPDFSPSAIAVNSDPGAPIVFRAGRRAGTNLNPYTGEEMSAVSEGLETFFRNMTSFHRWFSLTGESRNTARAITGASNLIFLFLVLSGMYLWLPKLWKWGIFKARLLLTNKAPNSKARDFNWHHVFGIWSAIPLVIVVATACVFSYGWANSLVYLAYGEEVPTRGRGGPPPQAQTSQMTESIAVEKQYLTLEQLFSAADIYARTELGAWRELSINIPAPNSATTSFSIDLGNGGQPHLRHNLSLNRETGELDTWQPFSSQTAGQQTRSIVRFLHTGEALGIWGQTIAGIVSFTSILMVWTGLALSYRRLIQPLFRRRKKAQT